MRSADLSGHWGFRQRLMFFVGAALLILWGVAGYNLWRLHEERHLGAEKQAQGIALAMDEYVKRSIQAVDLAMRGHAEAIARLGHPPENDAATVGRMLAGGDAAFARAFVLAVFDARGNGVAASEPGFDRTRNFADRPYFKTHVDTPGHGLFIGEPLVGRTFGKRFFSLSRRIEGPGGRFLGVIMGSIDARYIADYFGTHVVGTRGSIALVHVDKQRVIARMPDFEGTFTADVGKSEIFQENLLAKASIGGYCQRSAVDGELRMFTYRRIADTPLMIVAGIAERDIAQEVFRQLPFYASLLLILSLLLCGGALMLLRAHDRLNAALGMAHGMIEGAPIGIALYDVRDGNCVACNQSLADMLGATHAALLEQNYRRIGSWETSGLAGVAARAIATGKAQAWQGKMASSFGKDVWATGRLATYEEQGRMRLMLMLDDRTTERLAESDLSLARRVIESSSEGVVITDHQNRIVSVNPAFERITGYSAGEVLGRDPRMFASGRHDPAFYAEIWRSLNETDYWEGEIWDRHKSGDIHPKWMHITVLRDSEDQRVVHYVAMFSDITARKETEEQIRHLAHHDPLTGLPNRFALQIHFGRSMSLARREASGVALMFLDLDRFKNINDTLGHHVGDELLCIVAMRLRQAVRESDLVARIGGDEFVVVMEGIQRAEDVAPVARKILDGIGRPYHVAGHELHTTPSIGISLYPADGDDVDTLMRNADTAMYHAKTLGRNNIQYFAAHMNDAARARFGIENALRAALTEAQFILNYQPQYDLATGRLTGFEALVRWLHPERGLVSPAEFIPIAEETGMIVEIGEWVFAEAGHQARRWLDAGLDFGHVAINVAAQHFRKADLAKTVRRVLAESRLDAAHLEIEITETGIMEADADTLEVLEALSAAGVRLSIDDFGTGYSSLAYLKRLPVQCLKIDRSFVRDIETDASDAAISRSIIALAHALGLDVVAEGVETQGQADFLRANGCDRVQGFLYARPLPADEAGRLMAARAISS